MEKTKPVQVVMLPTKDNTNIYHHKLSGKIGWTEVSLKIRHARISQHLYFISTDLIKKHDCYLESRYEREPFIDKADDSWEDDKTDPLFGKNPEGTFKVIASTDPSLGLPAIPTAWIKDVYVPSNGSIKEVKLATESRASKTIPIRWNTDWVEYIMKVTPDNEVVIVDEPNILEMTLKATTLSDDFIDQELQDVANNYAGSIVEKIDPDGISLSSLDLALAVKFGADWKAEQVANDTMEFIDWILKMRYLPDLSGEVWLSDFGPDGHVKPFTTKELYDIWQQNKSK